MKIISAFFADHVAIYEQKLFINGGVWDWAHFNDLPAERLFQMALIVQVASSDRGKTRCITAAMSDPGGEQVAETKIEAHVARDYFPDHLVFGIGINPTFTRTGRHVTLLDVDGDIENAFALPLSVRQGQ